MSSLSSSSCDRVHGEPLLENNGFQGRMMENNGFQGNRGVENHCWRTMGFKEE
ncbi:hypothetical protein F2Q69_00006629 [Brassica cretica]|uniref:Uncharacterized protein n=1 Tax=Brassica cretica TaxID=69181 RepID=A0A8S9NZR7_BRACR|nr:hypothetical protein F2Q69_00006629 [Brassica cretica]